MKTANEWLNEVVETVGVDVHEGGYETVSLIKRIQASALAEAAGICEQLNNNECAQAILKLGFATYDPRN